LEAVLIGGVGLGSSSDWPPLFRPWLKLRVRPIFDVPPPPPGGGGGGLLEGCLGFALDGGGGGATEGLWGTFEGGGGGGGPTLRTELLVVEDGLALGVNDGVEFRLDDEYELAKLEVDVED